MKIQLSKLSVVLVGTLLFCLPNNGLLGQTTATEQDVRRAFLQATKSGKFKLPEYKTVFNWITENSGQEKWRQIDWRHNLWDARLESAKAKKPIFIWAMNGDPLGCV